MVYAGYSALTTSHFGLSVLLLNRWWGEKGFIRVQRHSSDKGAEGYCGTDYDPKQGHKSKKQLAEVNFDDFISLSSVFVCFDYFSFQTKFWCQPEITGVGCEGGPATLPVCGMCGILSDSVYPEGVSAMWDRRSCLRQPATVSRQSMFLIWNIIQEYLQIFFSPHRGWIAIVWWIVGCDALIPISLQ